MPTIAEVYNPIIEAAVREDATGHDLLRSAGEGIHRNHPDKAKTPEEGVTVARNNLDYYCQYFDAKTAAKVKEFYSLGQGLMTLGGVKLP